MSGNDDYTTGNLLDFLYHQNYCKRIGIDSSRSTNTTISQHISTTGKFEKNDGVTMLFAKKQKKLF